MYVMHNISPTLCRLFTSIKPYAIWRVQLAVQDMLNSLEHLSPFFICSRLSGVFGFLHILNHPTADTSAFFFLVLLFKTYTEIYKNRLTLYFTNEQNDSNTMKIFFISFEMTYLFWYIISDTISTNVNTTPLRGNSLLNHDKLTEGKNLIRLIQRFYEI